MSRLDEYNFHRVRQLLDQTTPGSPRSLLMTTLYQPVNAGGLHSPPTGKTFCLVSIDGSPYQDSKDVKPDVTPTEVAEIKHAADLQGFLPAILAWVQKEEPVRMILPAFPFKSPNNQDKTLGLLPDLGEELALQHLHGLCLNIAQVYRHGAEVHIASDGLVYNDILGVSDEAVWDYGEALRQIAVDQGLHQLRFIRLADLLGHPGSTKQFYLDHASCLRRELAARFQDPSFDPREAIKTDMDLLLTYRGYLRFLTKDLVHRQTEGMSKRAKESQISETARCMLSRGQIYASALKAQRGDYVRLSIHESTAARKLSVALIPQGKDEIGYTPWHSCVVVGLDGSYRTTHVDQVRDTHELVYKAGRPYCYRERSELWDWTSDGLTVQFEHLYPCGLIIRPSATDDHPMQPSIQHIPMRKLRELAHTFSPIICRGFARTDSEDAFIETAKKLGPVLPWTHGIIKKVKDSKRLDKQNNNVESNEAMPMHYDGMFKFEHTLNPATGETLRRQAFPRYQVFTCRTISPRDGFTLFASSRLALRHLPAPWTPERLTSLTWAMDNDGFWEAKITDLPLIVPHPVTGLPCFRWHQPWDASKTKFSTCVVTIENADAEGDGDRLVQAIDQVLYDYRVCLRFAWEVDDLVVNDNVAMLHTRTAYFNNADRELWRIHCD
ncbi:Clavaminate synthase-like protein [Aspergillus egyptiacus]|nr:Clavaminate synthase-like protein [Aspergillus egyptiacus]